MFGNTVLIGYSYVSTVYFFENYALRLIWSQPQLLCLWFLSSLVMESLYKCFFFWFSNVFFYSIY